MVKKRPFLILLAIAGALAGAAMPAAAAIEVFSASYGSSGSPLPFGGDQSLSLNKFDTSLGVLTDITIDLYSEDTAESEILNCTPGNLPYSAATTTIPVVITALGGLTTTLSATAGPFSGVAPARSVTVDGGPSPINVSSSVDVALGDFAAYEGLGSQTFDLSVLIGEPFIEGSGANLAFAGLGSSYGSVEVVYGYTSVPEPGNGWAGLVAAGLCGIAVASRLRLSRA
jgi:hypothetical protein